MLQNLANFFFGAEKKGEDASTLTLQTYNEDEWIVVEKNELETKNERRCGLTGEECGSAGECDEVSVKEASRNGVKAMETKENVLAADRSDTKQQTPATLQSDDGPKTSSHRQQNAVRVPSRLLCDVGKDVKSLKVKNMNGDVGVNKKKSLNRMNKNSKVFSKQNPERKYNITLRYSSKSERTC
ncbi:hypothetical protein HELRODRAFT_180657 [Helobdella robusta]|uniref:Uncharacterized protein n=1 Tax=Helobdella robusta TaxID=6412 RepID=T1FG48_HELRO|nr:hypothetical protein HELRODRAFT_180657 [Helobdella robusta]ESN93787.1 hypothetical protein HELRODRAFT_180657 [Helobdella robusta]